MFQKYRAIFDYFDSLLVGLTATPKDEVDRNTYALFDIESGVPTDSSSLEEAVQDRFLVPLKFQREGIEYDELSEDEKEQWDAVDWSDDGQVPDKIEKEAVNKWLFNKDTVDKVLEQESRGLGLFIRSLVGLDRGAAKDALSTFTTGKTLGANQIQFVNLIVDHLTQHGVMPAARLYESPFTDLSPRGPDDIFTSSQMDELMTALDSVRATPSRLDGGCSSAHSVGRGALEQRLPAKAFESGRSRIRQMPRGGDCRCSSEASSVSALADRETFDRPDE